MKLKHLQIDGFRTYAKLELDFSRRLNFITGRNAAGKTNILEAISILSQGKSFRGAVDADMIGTAGSAYYLAARFERDGKQRSCEAACDAGTGQIRRRFKLDGKQLSGRQGLIGQLVSVVFSPADIMIVDGGPSYRRRFLDMVLSNHDRQYLEHLVMYNRALKQRNTILKKMRKGEGRLADLDPWNAEIARYAETLIRQREKFLVEFTPSFQRALETISGDHDRIRLELLLSQAAEREDFAAALKSQVSRDTRAGYTTIGPHRHNLGFLAGGGDDDITRHGSQGQKRSLVLALRFAQYYYLSEKIGTAPLLLIDDVLNELDSHRRRAFVQLLQESGQAIFTTPELEGLDELTERLADDISIYRVVEKGTVEVQ